MEHPYWPILDLRISAPPLALRPMNEADQAVIAELLPDDVELNPAATRYDVANERNSRGIVVHQGYWKAYGTWRPEEWRLSFVVLTDGEPIGVQELEGNDFVRLRTVDTSSFLVPAGRGRGHGKRMRQAVLSLAFGPLEAQAAITSAWQDNHASLGVSRSLGYRPNGEMLDRRDDGVDVMVHLRLTRESWIASQQSAGITVSGFEPCRPLFGLVNSG